MKVILISLEESPSLFFPFMQDILIKNGHDPLYFHIPLDLRKSDAELSSVVEQLKKLSNGAGLFCISCMTNTFFSFKRISKKLKDFGVPIAIGGVHPTVKPEESLELADYVCVGEGEEALPELIERIANKKRTDNIKNIYVKKNGEIIRNLLRPIVQDLDTFPVPRFYLDKIFYYHNGQIKSLNSQKGLINSFYKKYFYVITSRGCPYRCKYCLNDCLIKIHKDFARLRRRTNAHVIRELKNAKRILPKDEIIGFVDDDFCAQPFDNLKKFCELYKKEISMPFFCASTPTSISEEKLKVLLDAGMVRLEIGIQSISDKVNKEIFGRFALKNSVVKAVKMLENYRDKLEICYDFILDNPWETDDTRQESLEFVMDLKKPYTLSLFSLTLYPGTGLYERAKKEGIIKNDFTDVYLKNHMLLNNGVINTFFVLYSKYNLPKDLIRLMISGKNLPIFGSLLKNSTYILWRAHNYYVGLKDSLKRRDKENRDYYLKAPIKQIIRF